MPFKALAIAWPASKPLGPLYRRASSGPIRLRCSGNELHTSKLRRATERQQPLKSQTTLQICNRTKNAIKELDPAAASQNITRFQDEWLPRNMPRNPSPRGRSLGPRHRSAPRPKTPNPKPEDARRAVHRKPLPRAAREGGPPRPAAAAAPGRERRAPQVLRRYAAQLHQGRGGGPDGAG